jgi:hypothetical protein
MRTIIAAAISLMPLMAALSALPYTSLDVFAISDYQFGLKLGIIDGKNSLSNGDTGTLYVLQSGQGFINQTKEF